MSNRTLRVNELLLREFSDILRKRYQSESVGITLTEIRVAPDLRDARVFVSVLGDDEEVQRKVRWLKAHSKEFRHELGSRIVLKFMPRFEYLTDHSAEQGARILQVLDEIGLPSPNEKSATDTP
ncbi:MAG: 30S ribosome-binding factor RbfA [Opitutus sp.]